MAVIAGRGTAGPEEFSFAGGTSNRDYFDIVNTVTMDASAESFDIVISPLTGGNAIIRVKFFRPSGNQYLYLGESQSFSLPAGTHTDQAFDTPISVQTGDLFVISLSSQNTGRISGVTASPTEIGWAGGDSDFTSDILQSQVVSFANPRGMRAAINGTPSSDTITPVTRDYTFRRAIGGQATIPVTFTWTGSPASIEYSINGGAYQVGDASPTGGTSTFNVTVSTGENTVTARFSDQVGVNATITNLAPGYVVSWYGASNESGRGTNNQTYADNPGGATGHLYGNDEEFKVLADPFDSNANQVDLITEDTNATGSYIPRFANSYLANNNIPVCMIPCAKGGSSIASLQKDSTDRIGGLNRYESMAKRINACGGVDIVVFGGGGADANDSNGTTRAQYEADLNQLINDINADFGCRTLIRAMNEISIPGYDGDGVTTGQVAIRAGQVSVAESNPNAMITVPMTDIDLSGGDGLHFQTDFDLNLVGERVFAALIQSTFTMTNTGTPDGVYTVDYYNDDTKTLISTESVTFSSGNATAALNVDVGTNVFMFEPGGNPPTTGICYYGVTT